MVKSFTKLFLILIFTIIAAFVFFHKNKAAPESEAVEKTSGAYQALSFFGESRSYPERTLPEGAYFTAWQETQRMDEAASAYREVDPWETMGPHNLGGRTLSLAFNPQNPNTLYAGSASGGLWRSYSAGVGKQAWEKVETGHPVLGVSIIEFMPNDSMQLFIGTGEVYNVNAAGTGAADRSTRGSYGIGILRSNDGGESWEPSLDWTYDQNKGVWDIEIAPSDHNIIYAGTTDGVYKSIDGGDNWNLVHDVVFANDIAVHPNDPDQVIVGCGNFSSPGFGIYRTQDGGDTWEHITTNLPSFFAGKVQLAVAPSQPDILYASIGNGFTPGSPDNASWLCRSVDFGKTWTVRNQTDYSRWQGWFSHDVVVNPNDPNDLTVIGIEIWKSSDGGQNLIKKSLGGVGFSNPNLDGPYGLSDYVHSDAHDVIYHPSEPNVFFIASDGGVTRSLDNGETFETLNGGYQTAQFYNGFSNSAQNPDVCMGGLQDNGTIQWNGPNDDFRWTRVNGGDGSWSAINQQNDDIRYVSWQRLNVRKTINGIDYPDTTLPIVRISPRAFIAPFLVAPSDGNILYAGSSIVAKSFNGGTNWTATNNGLTLDGNPILSMSMSYINTEVVYVATAPYQGDPGSVLVTLNGGNTWENVTGNLPDRYPMDLQVDPTDDAVAYVGYSGYGTGHIFRTDNYGETWTDISGDLPDLPINAIEVDPLFPNNIYVGNDIGVYVSTDYGQSWETYQDGLSSDAVMVFDLRISPANRKLRAATHGLGAFQRDLLEEPFVNNTTDIENSIAEINIFPNPTSDFATVEYQLNIQENISIELLNNMGRVINTVFNDRQMAGKHVQNIDVNNLANGIYYVKIKTEQNMLTKRLAITR